MAEVRLAFDGHVATITLNRPRVLNAMNMAFTVLLAKAIEDISKARDVRVVLIRGEGRAFSSGIDLDMRTDGIDLEFFARQEQARLRLESLSAISIAAVHGYCLGGGLQLAIACDIRVTARSAQLGLPAVHEGLFPGLATARLPRLIGLGPARRLVLSGASIDADEALRLGLVDHVVPDDDFETSVDALVRQYLEVPSTAAAASKQLMNAAFDVPLATLAEREGALFEACLRSPAAEQAVGAWRTRRSGIYR